MVLYQPAITISESFPFGYFYWQAVDSTARFLLWQNYSDADLP